MQAGKSKPKCHVCIMCSVLKCLLVSKVQGLPPIYNNAPMPGKSAEDLAVS